MKQETNPKAPRSDRRFRFRFSLRSLLLLILLIAAPLAWMANDAREQAKAVADLRRYAIVHYNWHWKNGKIIPNGKPRAPNWLVEQFGIDYFGHPLSVWLHDGEAMSAKQWTSIKTFRRLKRFEFYDMEVTDAALSNLRGFTCLESIVMRRSALTNEGLRSLATLDNLRQLDLYGSYQIDDKALDHLKRFRRLEVLRLQGSRVTDEGLITIGGMTQLEELDLSWTNVSEAGLVRLEGLNRLKRLKLDRRFNWFSPGVQQLQTVLPKLMISTF